MKRTLLILAGTLSMSLLLQQAIAQQVKKKPASAAAATKVPDVAVTLGNSSMSNGTVTKQVFDSLMKQGLHTQGGGMVKGFNFIYAERMLYEDSAGNPLVTTDYLQEYCIGDALSPGIRSSLFDRTKPGDTVYFNQIKVLTTAGTEAHGTAMKFVIAPAGRRR